MVSVQARAERELSGVPDIGRCFIARRLVSEMVHEANAKAPLETGGVLLGVSDGANIWIDAVIGPGPGAVHRRMSFSPDAGFQEQQITEFYEASGRRATYLGDWHTHPGTAPYLSWRDRRTLRAISRTPSARQPTPLMLVFGYGDPWRVVACRYEYGLWYRPRRLNRLEVVID